MYRKNNKENENNFNKREGTKTRSDNRRDRNFNSKERSFDKKDRDFDRPERRRYKSNNEEYHNHNSRFRSFEKTKRRGITTQKQQSESVRLNKFIANSGVCSRREADELIAAGFVSVNDKVIKEMGFKVSSKDTIKLKGKKLTGEKKVYILLNKPKDFITTTDDERGRKTVMDLVKNACRERIYPVGRLDRNTTGVLLLTNDGDLTKMLTHPSYGAKKIYHVELNKRLKQSDIQLLLEGVELEDGIENVDDIQFVEGFPGRKVIGVEIHSGKNRIVRRLFEQLEYEVEKLDRVSFAGLTKRDLPRGHWRMLKDSEVSFLKMHHIPKN
ncbi:MAG: pseudouridine synthase [Bacteroidales bacterium]|jgi:23S rRNA pseudouridine2605 synthase|nr:pseudouridine synthase [Bacteroidales bacterium]